MFQEANILLNNKNWFKLRTELVATHPSQIAEFIETLEPEQQVIVFRILPVKIAARTFEHIELETQQSLLKSLGQVKMGRHLK